MEKQPWLGYQSVIIQEAGTLLDNRGLPTAVESRVEQLAADDKVSHWSGYVTSHYGFPLDRTYVHKNSWFRERLGSYICDGIGHCLMCVRSCLDADGRLLLRHHSTPMYHSSFHVNTETVFHVESCRRFN